METKKKDREKLPGMLSLKRIARYLRHVTVKGESHGKCVSQEDERVGKRANGTPLWRTKYYHVTKGWRSRAN